jgi:hypothetical protein
VSEKCLKYFNPNDEADRWMLASAMHKAFKDGGEARGQEW